ncbi:MAG: hypothetical protein ACHQZR_01930 [Candidatus Limnocylindrales bacterium]
MRPRSIVSMITAVLVASCAGPTTALPSVLPTALPSALPTATAPPASAVTPGPTATGAPSAPASGGLGWNVPFARTGNGVLMAITDVRTGAHGTYDRVTWEFAGDRLPTIGVVVANAPFVRDPSGLPMVVRGTTFLRVTLTGMATAYDGPRDVVAGYRVLQEVALQGHYEGVSTWIVGLDQAVGVHVYVLTGPDRLVIDVG